MPNYQKNTFLDWMSILIELNANTTQHVDYLFKCNLYTKDPRYKSRNIIIGQNQGLLRLNKKNLEAKILLPMEYDTDNQVFYRAVSKIIKEYKSYNEFPKFTHFACG